MRVDPSGRAGASHMSDATTTRASASTDGIAIEPTLVLTFFGHGNGGTQRRRIPREGILLGREAVVFEDAFNDPRMSERHTKVRIAAAQARLRDLGSELGTQRNAQLLSWE